MAEIASGTAKLDDLSKVLSVRFEDLAREFLLLKRPFEFETLGRWWFRGEEIDIVALGKDKVSLIEVKWKDLSERDARRVLGSWGAKQSSSALMELSGSASSRGALRERRG